MSAMTVEQVRKLLKSGMTDGEIAAQVGAHRVTVQKFRAKHRIAAVQRPGKTRRWRTPKDAPSAPPSDAPRAKPITIAEFLMNKRRAVCPVCQLKEPVKSLVADARKKGERQADIIEYLHVCHRLTITPHDFSSHVSGRHDQ